jgi:sulfatase maturation enzyme AslB (radical SAM superfamily)
MDLSSALENIYISPLELCNLDCKLCYTNKTDNILTNPQILNFIKRYRRHIDLKSVLFCGGEVFTLKSFPRLVNRLLSRHIFISIITNGTIDRLKAIRDPKNCQLLVSFDGPKDIHDRNRGQGNYDRSVKFVARALKLGFPVEIMYLVTPESRLYVDSFNIFNLKNNLITQKTYFYTANHPLSNQKNTAPALTPKQIINIKKNYSSLPPKNFGCFQLSLQSDGRIYGCCESPHPLAKMSERIPVIIKKFHESLVSCQKCGQCLGCCTPDFFCGYKNELGVKSCQQVVHLFNN